jgi:hypothetical protein
MSSACAVTPTGGNIPEIHARNSFILRCTFASAAASGSFAMDAMPE